VISADISFKNDTVMPAKKRRRGDDMRATVSLPQDLLAELMSLLGAKNKNEAVLMAVKDEIRLRKAAQIKAMAGKMEFTATAEELRHGDQRLG
jgi:Arc/MetJ family transcription regulator